MDRSHSNNTKPIEERLKELKKDFLKTIPQLQKIQEVQEVYRRVQEEKTRDQYPFINTRASSTG